MPGQPANNLNIYLKHNKRVAQNISPVKRAAPGVNDSIDKTKQPALGMGIIQVPV